jgi:hypothetical protein
MSDIAQDRSVDRRIEFAKHVMQSLAQAMVSENEREARVGNVDAGSTVTRAEVEALAKAWWVTPAGLIAPMPDPRIVAD